VITPNPLSVKALKTPPPEVNIGPLAVPTAHFYVAGSGGSQFASSKTSDEQGQNRTVWTMAMAKNG
jgi:hypothetical protein